MTHTHIRVRGARTNNLRGLDVDIARGSLTVVVGVSGSGKSSLVFDTLAAEAGHQVNESYPPFVRNRLPKWTRPDVDHLSGLSPVVMIDQRRIGGNSRSTVGTITDTWAYLRLIFSRLSEPFVGDSNRFSFNDPAGMCPRCTGLGETIVSDVEKFLDLDLSLADGAIRLPGFGDGGYWHGKYADIGTFDADAPLREWSPHEREALLYGGAAAAALGTRPPDDYEGVVTRFERIYLHTGDSLSERKQAAIAEFTHSATCPECDGERLSAAGRRATVGGRTIGELSRIEVAELIPLIDEITDATVAPATAALRERLIAMDTIGLGYLTLARATPTLSGGESQRVKLVKHLGSSLTELLYVVDEPTVGLHPTDVAQMTELLIELRDAGNTVLVVEHDPAVMARADEIIEIGPDGGAAGGRLIFQGSYDGLRRADTPTGIALRRPADAVPRARRPRGELVITETSVNNLRGVTARIPLGVLTVMTGVAGSGKSSLAAAFVDQHDAVVVDQRPVSTSRRSTPVTYTGVAPAVRKLFATTNGVPARLFSANSEGGCPACKGLGVIHTDLAFMDGQDTPCGACRGRRFRAEVLEYRVGGLSIADVDDLTVAEASAALPSPAIGRALAPLASVGLEYLRLGQPLSTLSGGEAQRTKIARELHQRTEPTVYVFDEPTTGLHRRDVEVLMQVLNKLLDAGHTAVVIEHDMAVAHRADWLIDLGPGPGRHGGTVLHQGTVAEYLGASTPTARALAAHSR